MELAGVLRHTFQDFVCHNRKIHFSAGMSIHKPHTPLERLAEGAESALAMSKHLGKNRFTLFGETVTWDELDDLKKIKNTLQGVLFGKKKQARANVTVEKVGNAFTIVRIETGS
jgi:CRISPR-associated protein Csm1